MLYYDCTILIPTTKTEWTLAAEECQARFLEQASGYIMTDARGAYTMADGTVAYEPCVKISCLMQDWGDRGVVWPFMRDMARMVKQMLNEESVLVTISEAGKVVFV